MVLMYSGHLSCFVAAKNLNGVVVETIPTLYITDCADLLESSNGRYTADQIHSLEVEVFEGYGLGESSSSFVVNIKSDQHHNRTTKIYELHIHPDGHLRTLINMNVQIPQLILFHPSYVSREKISISSSFLKEHLLDKTLIDGMEVICSHQWGDDNKSYAFSIKAEVLFQTNSCGRTFCLPVTGRTLWVVASTTQIILVPASQVNVEAPAWSFGFNSYQKRCEFRNEESEVLSSDQRILVEAFRSCFSCERGRCGKDANPVRSVFVSGFEEDQSEAIERCTRETNTLVSVPIRLVVVHAGLLFSAASAQGKTVEESFREATAVAFVLASLGFPCAIVLADIDLLCPASAHLSKDQEEVIQRVSELLARLRSLDSTSFFPVMVVSCSRSGGGADRCHPSIRDLFDIRLSVSGKKERRAIISGPSSSVAGKGWEERLSLRAVAGNQAAKTALRETLVWPRLQPSLFRRLRLPIPLGVLLLGPPGTGKTLLAREVAKELAVGFISIRLTDVVRGEVGVGERTLRRLFRQATQQAPCVVFVDEMQALFVSRDAGSGSELDKERLTTSSLTNTLLGCMDELRVWNDSMGASLAISVLAATNEPWAVDKALLRPGRFDRIVHVEPPDRDGRKDMFVQYLQGLDVRSEILEKILDDTEGFTGAEISLLVRRATKLFALSREELGGWGSSRPIIPHHFLVQALQESQKSTKGADRDDFKTWMSTS